MQINASIPAVENSPAFRPQTEIKTEIKAETKEFRVVSELPKKEVEKTENIEKLQNIMAEHNMTLKFSQDKDTKEIVVELVDDKTGEAIRQIPSQVSLKLAAIFVKMQGQFVDKTE
jgi:flagellar protein FlaG